MGYKLGTDDFDADVHRVTLHKYDYFRRYPYEDGASFDLFVESTTKYLRRLTQFYWSGGITRRYEAVDILSWELCKTYLVEINKRFEEACR